MNGNDSCFHLGNYKQGINRFRQHNLTCWTNVTSKNKYYDYVKGEVEYDYMKSGEVFCNSSAGSEYQVSTLAAWTNNLAKAIPPGYFMIYGDKTWHEIPVRAYGGPCYFGKLIMFAPAVNVLKNHTRAKRAAEFRHPCRDRNDSHTLKQCTVDSLYCSACVVIYIFPYLYM